MFIHLTVSFVFGILHLHKTEYDSYKRMSYPKNDIGTVIIKELYINDIINKLEIDSEYFKNYTIPNINTVL